MSEKSQIAAGNIASDCNRALHNQGQKEALIKMNYLPGNKEVSYLNSQSQISNLQS